MRAIFDHFEWWAHAEGGAVVVLGVVKKASGSAGVWLARNATGNVNPVIALASDLAEADNLRHERYNDCKRSGGHMVARNITVEEAAHRIGKSTATVRRLLGTGELGGQKVGGRWIVFGDKLPIMAASSGNSPSPISDLDMGKALSHVLHTDRKELWVPDVLNWEDFKKSPDSVVAAALSKCSTGRADPFEVVEVPKDGLLSRAGTLLSIEDRVAFQALCATFSEGVEERLSDRVFSSRLDRTSRSDFFKPGLQQWSLFEAAVDAEANVDGNWLVKTDLVSYFETISHQLLFEELRSIGVPNEVTKPLREMLREWRRSSQHGLPTGSDASRLLGNLFLARIDQDMLAEGYRYWRFMDDVRIVADSEIQAVGALRRFEVLCRERGLIVSGAKTTVTEINTNTKPDVDSAARDRADYFLNNGMAQARSVLRQIFNSALNEKSIKKKNAKFALLRLGTLVDRSVMKKLLARLDSLQDLSPDSAFYLRSFISEKGVQTALTKYLSEPGQPGVELYQQAWLVAAMLEVLDEPPVEWVSYARQISWDANKPAFLRGLAFNLVALGRDSGDVEKIRIFAQRNYDPGLVRSAATALRRVGELDKQTRLQILARHPQLKGTIEYLIPRESLPSLIQDGLWSSVRAIPNN